MFSVRVYGILINNDNEVLVADEFHYGRMMTKFPGGGLEFGEGVVDCLKREFREEVGQEPLSIRHFYTTEFFQPTAMITPPKQLISIYYLVSLPECDKIVVSNKAFNIPEIHGSIAFRWIALEKISAEIMTFPIDKVVVDMLALKKVELKSKKR